MDESPMPLEDRAQFARVEAIIPSIESPVEKARAWLKFALALERANLPEQAAEKWSEAIQTAHTIKLPYYRTSTLCELALGLERVQHWE